MSRTSWFDSRFIAVFHQFFTKRRKVFTVLNMILICFFVFWTSNKSPETQFEGLEDDGMLTYADDWMPIKT
jgi:hypothetical protein